MAEQETLSAAEQAYFESGGQDTSGLEMPSEAPQTSQPQEDVSREAPDVSQQAANDDERFDGEVELDENGHARDKATGRYVPHSAMHKERERRKAVESELEQYRDRYTRAEERLNVLNDLLQLQEPQAQQPGQQPVQQGQPQDELGPAPDPEEDIFGFVKWQAKKIELMERGQQEAMQRQQEQVQHQQYAQQVQEFYKNDAIQYLNKQPDFPDAYRHVANSYANELRAQGVPEDRVNTILMAEEARIAAHCRQEGRSPSEVIYQMALARGYSPKQAEQAAQQETPPPQQNPRQNTANRIQNIQRGQQATIPMSKAGGASAEGLTLEALADMSEEEFASVTGKLSKSQLRQLMGG